MVSGLKKFFPAALCVLCGAGLAAALYFGARLEAFELRLYDLRARLLPAAADAGSGSVVCGLIDDQSIRALGPWPWPRKVHALFLDALRTARPAVVAYDLKFHSPTGDDEVFAATAGYFDSLCFAYDFRLGALGPGIPPSDEVLRRGKILAGFALSCLGADVDLPRAGEVILPVSGLAARGLGFANAPRDSDGVLRALPLIISYEGRAYPSLALFCACRALGVELGDVRLDNGRVELVKDGAAIRSIPVDGSGRMLVRFSRPGAEPFAKYLYVQLLKSGRAAAAGKAADIDLNAALDGRVLMVGHTATGSMESLDVGATPVSGYMPYMFAHAEAVENIIGREHLRWASPWAQAAAFALCAVLSGAVSFLFGPLAAVFGFAVVEGIGALVNLVCFRQGIVLNLLLPALAALCVYLLCGAWRLLVENRDKRFLKKVFGHYVSPAVLNALVRRPESLRLGGEKRELSVLFADIRGFTAYCETRDPELVVGQLNEYFDRMTGIICANNGTLDKYIGDCIMAVFGAPSAEACPEHAFMAVKSALEMRAELGCLQEEWRRAGRDVLDIGIGINTGLMLVGNMGSSSVWDYTVVGDEVNLAARLESLTRERGVGIIVSESTYLKVASRVRAERLGPVTVKGKAREVVVYAVSSLLH